MLSLGKVQGADAGYQSYKLRTRAVNNNTDEQCIDAGGDVFFALQALRTWVAASSNRELTVGNDPVLQPLLEQVRLCGAGTYIITHLALTEPAPQVTVRDGSEAQWRALQLAAWLFEQPECAVYVTWRLSASACCGDRSTEFAAALVIRYLAEVSVFNGCGASCTGRSSNLQYVSTKLFNVLACNVIFLDAQYIHWQLAS